MKPIALSEYARIQPPPDIFTGHGRLGGTFRVCYAFYRLTPSLALRLREWPIAFAVLAFLTIPPFVGTAEQSQLFQAQNLSNQGEFAQVVRVLEPLVHGGPDALDNVSRGWAWNTLGFAHENLGEYEAARRCYESAIQLLRTLPAASSTYASAMANLGAQEISTGQLEAAEITLRKVKRLYAHAADHTGLAEIATTLATLALARNDTHAARRFLANAFQEAESAKELTYGDRGSMYSIKGSLATKARDFAEAVSDHQQSIDFWTKADGPKCYSVGVEYALQADAYRELGEYGKANSDITEALVRVAQTVGRNTPIYAATELTYARLLRATGANAEAAQRDAEAKATLAAIHRKQCNDCSVSAPSLR